MRMATPFNQLLANSLRQAKKVAVKQIIRSKQLSRIDRARLIKAGCLQKIIRGWYLFCAPHVAQGESTLWYSSFWNFVGVYLQDRFGEDYCLSPEGSMDVLLGKNYLSPQVVVMAKTGGSISLKLPHNTSLLIYQEEKNFPQEVIKHNGINIVSFEYALCKMPPGFYCKQPQEAEIALRMLVTPEKILKLLLKNGMAQVAGRLIGALRHLHSDTLADAIFYAMSGAGFTIIETNPFQEKPLLMGSTILRSPYSARIESLWMKTRADIIELFPQPTRSDKKRKHIIATIDNVYLQDAYHSLSIEGYQVSENLIEKIASGKWQPQQNEEDLKQKNAMAAKGYYEAFKSVKNTINDMVKVNTSSRVLREQFMHWYIALFSPSITAGIIPAEQLAGFRNQPVYIRNAMHVPPPHDVVYDCMDTLFNCIENEKNAAVKAVLSHWLIGFIHPYVDGNGRMARFTMNALLVSNGYPWTIIHVENRKTYLDALEKASVHGDIKDFCYLIIKEMAHGNY